ncbi:arginine vasopressin-induced protein 1 [Eublepharis macularius]|uniref:Arginine vasopressin-induced protein 1 n=1 Tax=Eublepharis macularius TaxID=481883 RepID=A0AA97L0Y6_EUBMA|nr:arginine vasopressin-induced protein 1 [Eublepharis macularius]
MGTPASVACDSPPHPQPPKSCTRKRASADIFQGVGLLQLHHLFHISGDAQAEERAQLVWERAGKQCIGQALRQLHRKRKLRLRPHQKSPSESGSGTGFLELQHFSHLRIEDSTTSHTEDNGLNSSKMPDVAGQARPCPASCYRQKRRGIGAAGYLHQLH